MTKTRNTTTNPYAWLRSIPGLREWLGSLVEQRMVNEIDAEYALSGPQRRRRGSRLGIYKSIFAKPRSKRTQRGRS